MVEKVRTKRGEMRLPNMFFLRDMVRFYIESERPEDEAYLVDSSMVKDWECMIELLVEEAGLTRRSWWTARRPP